MHPEWPLSLASPASGWIPRSAGLPLVPLWPPAPRSPWLRGRTRRGGAAWRDEEGSHISRGSKLSARGILTCNLGRRSQCQKLLLMYFLACSVDKPIKNSSRIKQPKLWDGAAIAGDTIVTELAWSRHYPLSFSRLANTSRRKPRKLVRA